MKVLAARDVQVTGAKEALVVGRPGTPTGIEAVSAIRSIAAVRWQF
jgi:hypothetical protein